MVCLVIELSDRQELGGRYRPAHVGDLIRRMSAISQRDSFHSAVPMCFPTRTGTGPHGRSHPVHHRGKAHRPLCLLSLIHTRLSWGLTPMPETMSTRF